MKQRIILKSTIIRLLLILLMGSLFSCEKYPIIQDVEIDNLTGEYFGEMVPDAVPVKFCPGFFKEGLHTPPIFSPCGQEVYFKPSSSVGYPKIFEMKLVDGSWTEPYHASFNFKTMNDAPFITPDGERLYFLSNEGSTITNIKQSLYVVYRIGDDWSIPEILPDNINTLEVNWQFSLSDNYNLWFQSKETYDLYYSEYIEGEYADPVKLPEIINSEQFYEGSPFIALDESYLVFERREGGYSDLLISFKDNDGNWGEPMGLGPEINTDDDEAYGYVSADGRFLFFLRMTDEGSLPYWVDASFIEDLRMKK